MTHPLDDFYPDAELIAKLANFHGSRKPYAMTKDKPVSQTSYTYGTILNAFLNAKQTERPVRSEDDEFVLADDGEFTIAFAVQCSHVVDEWVAKPDITDQQRVEGAVAGVLAVMDGQVAGFPGVTVFAPKHGENDIDIFRDGKVITGFTDRTNYFHGGASHDFARLRHAAAHYQVSEGDDG